MRCLRPFFVLVLLVASTGTAYSQKVNPDDLRDGKKVLQVFRSVVEQPSEATVRVLAGGKEVALGAIVESDGWVLTKWSEIEGRRHELAVKFKDGTIKMAELRGVKDEDKGDEKGAYDLAILKIDRTGLKPVQWRHSKEATVGKWVASPGTSADPVAVGVISVASRKLKPNDQPPKVLNLNAGYLGVGGLQDAPDGGALIGDVPKGGPAEKAGLKANDVIYEAAGRRIVNAEALINTIGRLKPGEKVLLKVKRGAEDKEIQAVLGKRNPKDFKINPQELMGTKLSGRRGGFPTILQHDSGIRPEDCGGPLVDLDGKTVGINIARAGRTETFAIPSEDIQPLLPALKSGKLLPKNDDPDLVYFKVNSLTAKDPQDAKRKKLGPDRRAKVAEFKMTAGETYVVELTTYEKFDPYLIIEDPKGEQVAEDDDGAGFPNARISYKATTDGVYRIVATTFNPNETGGYALSIRRIVVKK